MTNLTPIKLVFLLPLLGLFLTASAEEATFADCYARWDDNRITVGNAHFERSWSTTDTGLVPTSFLAKNPDFEWLQTNAKNVANPATLEVTTKSARRSAVGSEGLRVEISVSSPQPERRVMWVFPELAGAVIERLEGAAESTEREQSATTGIEKDPASKSPQHAAPSGEALRLSPRHLLVSKFDLRDQTDHHNELVHEQEWLIWQSESPFPIRGCVMAVEHTLDGRGIAFLKLAPLPHARPIKDAIDFQVQPGRRTITSFFQGYPIAAVAYQGGSAGRTQAFHSIQRALRNYLPERDGLFLSNTWGDRSRDARIREDFLLKEVEAGARLGVDVIQIDDGWQKGRTANSSAAKGKGVWNGYWAADPEFWSADPERFPNGLEPIVSAAHKHGMKFGLWFGPDSSNDAANWKRDADHLLDLHKTYGIDYFKIDSMKSLNATSLQRQRDMFDRMLDGSDGDMTFDLDVTAEVRPGYFGLPDIGPIFLENRYTDWGSYWPHLTLRNLWQLSQTVDPLRLRIEVLNPLRNVKKYEDDPLAPVRYPADTLFAIAMMANPLGWFEVSNLPPEVSSQMQALVTTWKRERSELHGGNIMPIGSAPDGAAWTGFTSTSDKATHVLLFRELNPSVEFSLPIASHSNSVAVLAGRGTATIEQGKLTATIPAELDYLWVKVE